MERLRRFDPETLPAAWAETARHANFAVAARRLASNMLDLCEADPRLAAVFKDAGRYVAAMSAAYLHEMGGLTLPLLKQICAGSGFLSQGRARDILEFLLHIDYLRASDDPAQGRYLPTERFLSAWCRHLQAALDAGALIEPELAALSDQLPRPEMFAALLSVQAQRLHALTRDTVPFTELDRAFLHPHAGSQVMWSLMLAYSEDRFPASGEVKVSLSDLSKRFDVTHLHVRRLFRRAEEQGMLRYYGYGRIAFEPLGETTIRYHFAFQLSEIVECGRDVLRRQPTLGGG